MGQIGSKLNENSENNNEQSENSENRKAGNDLYWAARAGDLPRCETLLARGADVDHMVNPAYNQTPLHRASLRGRTPIVKLLIDKGASVNITDKIGGTPLHGAAQEGHLAAARLLVTHGARTDAADDDGVMPIHLAAQYNRHEMLEYLVREAGVSVNVVSTATIVKYFII